MTDRSPIFDEFCRSSRTHLNELVDAGKDELWDKLSQTPAHWHPNGFAVFRLVEDHALGTLRLHVWPTRRGPVREDSPPVHSHAWHLCSRILSGIYRETLYLVGDDPSSGASRYSASIDYSQAPNDFLPGPQVYVERLDTIERTAGQFHEIPAGVAHETEIPEGQFCATLLFTSPLQTNDVMMVGSQPIPRTSYRRPQLSHSETANALRELEANVWDGGPA